MSTLTTSAEAARRELGSEFAGELIGPDDAAYEEARTVYNAMIDRRPALIARCAERRRRGRGVSIRPRPRRARSPIRGGGHNGAGLGTCDDGLVIDLSLLKGIQVDPEARTVRVGAAAPGARWTAPPASTAWPRRAASSPPPGSAV